MSKKAAPQVSGQKSLFSFFSKAAPKPAGKVEDGDHDKGRVGVEDNSGRDTPNIQSQSSAATSKEASPTIQQASSLPAGKVQVKDRIAIFWPNDDEWYEGVVADYDSTKKQHIINYDDGQVEHLNLANEKFKILKGASSGGSNKRSQEDGDGVEEDDDDDDENIKRPRKAKVGANKKNKSVINDDDEEAEWDGEMSDKESGSDEEHDGSDASFVVSDDDEEEDSDESFDDDESEDSWSAKKRKRSSLSKSKSKSKSKKVSSKSSRKPPIDNSSDKVYQSTPSSVSMVPSTVTPGQRSAGSSIFSSVSKSLSTPKHLSLTPASVGVNSTRASNEAMEEDGPVEVGGVFSAGHHEHDDWLFLTENRKDSYGRSPDHPEFNPRTLFVPKVILEKQTPAMEQWWDFKSRNLDTVLFFKVGKFYELFHMDADVGFKELDLIYMKGYKAHSGFPEVSYGKYSSQLVAKGYRVARIEQTETPEMLKERNARAKGKKAKVVQREICSVLTKGTRTYCHFDEEFVDDPAHDLASSLLYCIKEKNNDDSNTCEYGITVVDSVIGKVTLAQFEDDAQRSRLRTMLCRLTPSEILLEAGHYSQETRGVIRICSPKAAIDELKICEEMPEDPQFVLRSLHEGEYFPSDSKKGPSGTGRWPKILQALIAGLEGDSSTLATLSLGGALWHLKRSFIDYEILSMCNFAAYVLPDSSVESSPTPTADVVAEDTTSPEDSKIYTDGLRRMSLDAVSLANLEILATSFDKSEKGSLWGFINRCKTPFGRRLLREWVIKPLFRPKDIRRRSEAVKELMGDLSEESRKVRVEMRDMCDLERLLGRVHSNGSKKRSETHPDGRAIMYEMPTYNARKIKEFGSVLEGFEKVVKVLEVFSSCSIQSSLLRRALHNEIKGESAVDALKNLLVHFRTIFDEKQAKKDGTIKPKPGVDPEYDQAKADIASLGKELESYLVEMKKLTGISSLVYWGSNKDRYQIEVPIAYQNKIPTNWQSKSQKKTHRRYWTPFIEQKLAQLTDAESRLKEAEGDTMRRVFEKFDSYRDVFTSVVSSCALLDSLMSLSLVSSAPGYCWPEIISRKEGESPVLHITAGRHPMLEQALLDKGGDEFISNSVSLGGKSKMGSDNEGSDYLPRLLLLSGPNMGGKSTLLRQTCLITIMAQLGCMVPADRCLMTPVDRIFTRVGASDKVLEGQSTFFVELAETANILHSATQDSLCILDELGRGTATHDGTAIAHAVVDRLVRTTRCNTLFATHYHSLIDDWSMDPRVRLGHMECVVESERKADQGEEVTFLYRLSDGGSPSSYGINVARLAQLPADVISLACKQSQEFQDSMNGKKSEEESGIGHLAKDAAVTYFDRLVSIVHSDLSDDERYYITSELWRRFTHVHQSS